MQLTYFRDIPNFGDALNPVLARHVFGDIFDDDDSRRVLFIGTIIERKAPRHAHEIIVGAGAGYKQGRYDTQNRTVLCVRGPLTCDLLGIDRSHAAIDPAILVSRYQTDATAGTGVAFMPHNHSHAIAGEALASICGEAGITYVSPLDDVSSILARLAGSSCLITEALHGAVVAEAYGVPWVPIIFSSKVLEKKWHDFAATIGVEYRPVDISTNVAFDGRVRPADVVKYAFARAGLGKSKYRYLPVRKPTRTAFGALERKLKGLTRGPFVKSDAAVKARSIDRLERALERFGQMRRDEVLL